MTNLLPRLVWLIPLLLLSVVSGQDNPNPGPSSATTSNYRWFCDLSLNPVVTLEWDSSRKRYVVQKPRHMDYYGFGSNNNPNRNSGEEGDVPVEDNSNQPWTRRLWDVVTGVFDDDYEEDDLIIAPPNLRSAALLPEWNHNVPALAVFNNSTTTNSRHLRLQEPQPTAVQYYPDEGSNQSASLFDLDFMTGSTVQARACDCWNSMVWGGSFYCPAPRTHCAIPSSPIGLPGCVDVQQQRRIVRSIWPVLVVWYASVLFCLSFTITGRHAMGCCISMIFPGWNRRTADRILRNDPNQANQMLLRHYRIMRAQYERRLMRRLRRRARRDRQRARRRQRQENNPNVDGANDADHESDNDGSDSDIMEDGVPFPNLWDLAIIPRPINALSDEPQPATLTLKTRIYKRKEKDAHHDNQRYNTPTTKEETSVAAVSKFEGAAEAALNFSLEREEEKNDTQKPTNDNMSHNDSSVSTKDETSDLAATSTDVDEIDPSGGEKEGALSPENNSVDNGGVSAEKDGDGLDVKDKEEHAAEAVVGESVDNEDEQEKQEEHADASIKGEEDEEEVTTSCIPPSNATGDSNDVNNLAPLPPPCCDHDQDFSEWDDDNTCTICYGPLEDGDRVGALPCGHEFHTDPCLKHWLTRRNVCPLCLTENIATPRYADGTLAPLTTPDEEDNAGNNNEGEAVEISPIVLNFEDSSTSDQDRSSSHDNSSGIVDDPNRIPAFFADTPNTDQPPRRHPRMIELTNLFRRRRRQDNGDSETQSPQTEQAP